MEIITVDVDAPASVLDGISVPPSILVVPFAKDTKLRVTGERQAVEAGLRDAGMSPAYLANTLAGARYATLGHAFALSGTGYAAPVDEDEDDGEDGAE